MQIFTNSALARTNVGQWTFQPPTLTLKSALMFDDGFNRPAATVLTNDWKLKVRYLINIWVFEDRQNRRWFIDRESTFAFDVSREGHIGNIRVALYLNPSDKRELKNVLSRKEQERGARFIASKGIKISPEGYGKTRYAALIFDKRTREYTDK